MTRLINVLHRFLTARTFMFSLAVLSASQVFGSDQIRKNWPQAAGPLGTWQVPGDNVPVDWSVSLNKNVLWKTALPEGGQSTVIVWGDRLFVITHKPWPVDADPKLKPTGADIDGYCLDSLSGDILWSVRLPSIREMKYTGIYSDSTSPSPVSDGEFVWFFNASGMMGCWDFKGNEIWTRKWQPRMRHHSRQFEPILFGDEILNVEVLDKEAAKKTAMHKKLPPGEDPKKYWTFLHGIDKRTGKVKWVAEAGTAIHNTPTFGRLADGSPAILHGRGGGHAPPEMPYGPSLTSLSSAKVGKTLWHYPIVGGSSHYTSSWNSKYACWFHGGNHLVLDAQTGKLLRKQPLEKNVTYTYFDSETNKYRTKHNTTLRIRRGKANSTPSTNEANLLVGNHHYFLTHESHCIGRVNIESGKAEYLQVPVQVVRKAGQEENVLWGVALENDTRNSRGIDIGVVDKRSKGDGWGHVSAASPIAVGSKIFLPTMVGMVYVIDANAQKLDQSALLAINDLGPAGETWSLSSLSYANGKVYHRSMKGVVCIGRE